MKTMFGAAVLAALAALALPARSQSPAAPSAANFQPPPPEQVVQTLANKLGLNAEQQNQLLPIIAGRQQQLLAIRADTSLMRVQKARRMKAVFDESDQKINALLNEQQRQQYAQLEQQMREQMKERLHSAKAGAR